MLSKIKFAISIRKIQRNLPSVVSESVKEKYR